MKPRSGNTAKEWILTVLLAAIAVTGPMVAYAGVSVVYPESTFTADVDEAPPITFAAGGDHAQANSIGFAGTFNKDNNDGSYSLTVNGLSGGKWTIDNMTKVSNETSVSSYKVTIDTALGPGISPTTFKIRLWTGLTAPSADADAQVCAVLDLTAAQGTETTGSCGDVDGVFVQVIYELPDSQTTQSDTVKIRPSSIVFK